MKVEMMPLSYFQVKDKEDGALIKDGKSIIKAAFNESPWSNGEIDEKYIELLVKLFLEHPDPKQRGLFIAMDGPLFIGLLAAIVNQGSVVKQCNELMWFVLPDYRKEGVGLNLMQMYGDWAKGLGINKITMSHYGESDYLKKFYEANGFKQTEVTYVKDLD